MLKKLLCVVILLLVSATVASAGSKRGKGGCIHCHQDGVPFVETGCGGCHLTPPASAAHLVHTDGSGAVYGNDANGSGSSYRFNCGNCHPTSAVKHGNNVTEVELYNTAATGFKKNNPSTATASGSGSATVCSNIYCHSAGQPGGVNVYASTPAWGGGFSGNRCAGCHSYPPEYTNKTPKANSHVEHAFSCEICHAGTTADGTTVTPSSHVNNRVEVSPGAGFSFSYTSAAGGGTCSNISCHANTDATWGGAVVCSACHGNPPPQAAAGYTGVDETVSPHLKHAGKDGTYGYACSECHNGNKHGNGTFQDVFLSKSGILAGGAATYDRATRTCSSLYCHSDGKGSQKAVTWSSATLDCRGCHGSDAAAAFSSSAAGEPNYANAGAGTLRSNSHRGHTGAGAASCDVCHTGTTVSGSAIRSGSILHANGAINVTFNPVKAGSSIIWDPTTKTCASISCHGYSSAQWGGSSCLGCHSIAQGSRAAVTAQFGSGSHHIQGTLSDDKCYQCHWEANSDGSVNETYHKGSSQPGAQIDLVVYGAGSRPSSYTTQSAVQYRADGSRGEISKINSHCLGCHSDQNNNVTPFGDGKTPRQYAWDGTSVASRYTQTGSTTWGKYTGVADAAKKDIAKAYSAHGNAAANLRGWNNSTGVDGAIADSSTGTGVQCYDCHNSHGSVALGVQTRYSSATGNKRGGILKTTVAGQGGYAIGYSPKAGGSAAKKDSRNPGASLCLDCHLNQTAQSTPWGYNSTYGAAQPVLGYFDTFMNYSTSGSEQRFPYKKKNHAMGGHFGASTPLSSSPMATVDGLCTPCHDPHGVSPTLGANQQYAVPLLKGTWVTSPYKEDTAPQNNTWQSNYAAKVEYHIDQNTFGSSIRGTVPGMTQTLDQSAGLCLSCHPKDTLTAQASTANPNPWKSKNRVHESVKGWKSSDGIVEHNYSCSKCHSAHTSSVLPRLMVTNCLDSQHKGRMAFNPAPVISGSSSGEGGSGSGRLPGSYSGSGWEGGPGDNTALCHDSATANGYGTDGTNQGWNNVTPWADATPTITSGPGAVTGAKRLYMPMDEALWNGTANEVKDVSGGNNHGTASSATTVAGGITGRSGSFNGTGSAVTINYATGTAPSDNFTVEAWIKPNAAHEIESETNYSTGGVYNQLYLFWPDNKGDSEAGAGISAGTNGISVYEHGNGYMPPLAVYQGSISSTDWTHVAVVYSNKRPSLYVNGALVRVGLQSLRSHVFAPRVIGGDSYGHYSGLVDEVSVFDRALSDNEILAHSQLDYSGLCGSAKASINWTTLVSASSYVDYGPTTSYGFTAGDQAQVRNHSVVLPDLVMEGSYHYRVRSVNSTGQQVVSGDNTFQMMGCIQPDPPPQPATGISAAPGNGQATVSWITGTGATSSLVRYGTASGVYSSTIDPAVSPLSITGLANGQTVYYEVGARNATGTTWSATYSVTPVGPPQAPTAISAAAGNNQLSISWTPGSGATSSLIRYGTATGTYGAPIDPATSPHLLSGLINGQTYYFQVGAKNSLYTTWSTEYSGTPVGPPTAPTVTSSLAGNGQFTVAWSAGTGSTSSLLRYGTVYGNYPNLIDPAASPATVTGLINAQRYYYQVGAKNSYGTTWGEHYSVVPVAPPQAPTYVTAVPGNGQISVSWSPGTGSSYSILRYGTVSGVYTTTINPATSPRLITGLANQAIYYQVAAVNGSGTTWSPQYTVTPTASAPTAATSVSAVPGYYQATVTWTAGTGATSSVIRYGTSSGIYNYSRASVTSPYVVTNVANSTTLYYQIGSVNAWGTTWSAQYSVMPSYAAPQAATRISAAPGNGQATISWVAGSASTSSSIRYGTAPGVYGTLIDPATSPRTITGLTNGARIYYSVGAKNASGTTWSAESSVVPGAPAAPVPVTTGYTYYSAPTDEFYYREYTSDCINSNALTLAWNPVAASDGDPVQYNVTLNGVPQGWQSGTTFSLLAAPGASYRWSVKARDAVHTALESPDSPVPANEWSTSCGGSSCPLVYSFNGADYSYETDVQGPSLSQAKKGARNVTLYGASHIVLDKLAPDQNGQFRVKLWESLQEAAIVDEAKLHAVEYPEGYEIVSSSAENTYYYGYVDPFTIYTIKDPVLPVSATDKNGQDVLAAVSSVDDNPAPMTPDDPDNFYTLDFGTIAHPEHAKLVIDGWQDINSKLFTSTIQIQPYVEVIDANGAWVKAKSFGMPAGDLKTMAIDLSNAFTTEDHRVRLHLGIKKAQVWLLDRVRLDDSAPVEVSLRDLPLLSADLQVGGHSVLSMPTLEHRLLVTDVNPAPSMNNFGYGNFTRYGEVAQLLNLRDDKYVIMNYADKLDMTFQGLSEPPAGMKRSFLLKTDLYYKEFKDYKYLDPLPFHAMTDYPYLAPESYPTDADHQEYLASYNTRVFAPPAAATLTAQASPLYTTGGEAGVTLQWSQTTAPDGDAVDYQVEVSSSSDFATIGYRSSWQSGTSWTTTLPVGTWYWRVMDRDSLHPIIQLTSATGSFAIVDRAPAAPVVTPQPDAVSTGGELSVNLQWQGVTPPDADAAEYNVEVSVDAGFSSIAYSSGWLSALDWSLSLPSGNWYWRVTARDSIHTGAVSTPSASDGFSITGG